MNHKTFNCALEVKGVTDEGRFSGYGSVFNNVDLHKDIILPGAFSESLSRHEKAGTMPAMLWQHSMRDVVGLYDKMSEDDHGLMLSGELFINDNIPEADKAYTLMKRKAVRGMSIGFNIPKGGETYNKEDEVWEIKEVDLVEVSIVTYPANPQAQIATVKAALESKTEFERLLRHAGFSRSQAKSLMFGGYDALIEKRQVDDHSELEDFQNLIRAIKPT
ncbi:MAG: HK97 family phage prohead protease [Deltaproteobacteria bacterium]|nr:MAG: HK97 family phage prohead protease [Deltaproteobacteria bacterium]